MEGDPLDEPRENFLNSMIPVLASSGRSTIASSLYARRSGDVPQAVYRSIWAVLAEWRSLTIPSRLSV